MTTVRVIGTDRTSNADLIADVAKLGYLRADLRTLDATYGHGRFWTRWRPADGQLHTNDLNPARGVHHDDVRHLQWTDRAFDVVVFDPPYKLNGTSTGKGPSASDDDYGVENYASRADRHQMICDGITECVRVLTPAWRERNRQGKLKWVGGILLVKCQDQVNGGRKWFQTDIFTRHAETVGLRRVDMLHLPSYRAQPGNNPDGTERLQEHAHVDYSTLLVLRKEQAEVAS